MQNTNVAYPAVLLQPAMQRATAEPELGRRWLIRGKSHRKKVKNHKQHLGYQGHVNYGIGSGSDYVYNCL